MKENRVAIQESSPGWSDSVTTGMCIVIIRGIGASDSVAFYTTAGIFERFGRPPLQIPGCRQPFSVGSVVASPRPHPRLLSEIATRFCDTPLFEPHCTSRASLQSRHKQLFLHTLASKSCRKGAGSAYALQDVSPGCSDSETRGMSQLTKRGFGAERSRAFCTMLA